MNTPMARRRSKSRGFTLIELLVVIAIISLLVSILLPSLTKAKKLAQEAVCLSNLRNSIMSLGMYCSEETDGLWVGCMTWFNAKGSHYWDDVFYYTEVLRDGGYVGDYRLFQCPSHMELADGHNDWGDYERDRWCGYGLRPNTGWWSETHGSFSAAEQDRPFEAEPHASQYPMFVDSVKVAYTTNHPQNIRLDGWTNSVHLRHDGQTAMAFGDGHAAIWSMDQILALPQSQNSNFQVYMAAEDLSCRYNYGAEVAMP